MTSYQVTAPEPFNFTHTEEWPRWIRRFKRFRQASGLVEKSEENQVNTLIYSMGDDADDIFQAFKLSVEDMKKYDTVKGKFDNYFIKKKISYMNEQNSTLDDRKKVSLWMYSSRHYTT